MLRSVESITATRTLHVATKYQIVLSTALLCTIVLVHVDDCGFPIIVDAHRGYADTPELKVLYKLRHAVAAGDLGCLERVTTPRPDLPTPF